MIFSLALVFLGVAIVRMAAGILAFVHKLSCSFPPVFFLINRSIDQRHRLLFASLLALYKMEKRAEGGLTQEEITLLLSGILTIAFTTFTSKKEKTQNPERILNFNGTSNPMAPRESTAKEVSFEWSHLRVSSTDSKVRTILKIALCEGAVQ